MAAHGARARMHAPAEAKAPVAERASRWGFGSSRPSSPVGDGSGETGGSRGGPGGMGGLGGRLSGAWEAAKAAFQGNDQNGPGPWASGGASL